MTIASVCNFEDNNTLLTFAKRISELISILERKSLNLVDWFDANKIKVSPDDFQVNIDRKSKTIQTGKY